MKYYHISVNIYNIDKFLFICNTLDIPIVSVTCDNKMFHVIYKSRWQIKNKDIKEMYLDCFELNNK